jgi:hypothetical protein
LCCNQSVLLIKKGSTIIRVDASHSKCSSSSLTDPDGFFDPGIFKKSKILRALNAATKQT